MDWDVFISHAWEDKESFVRPLAKALEAEGLRVWFDEFTLTVGGSLRRSIDRGLANSRYGIVILSESFFKKEWPQKELDGLAVREVSGEKVILPVWHNITAEQVSKYSPTLADRIAVSSSRGLKYVVAELLRAMQPHLQAKVGDEGQEEAERKAREAEQQKQDRVVVEETKAEQPQAIQSIGDLEILEHDEPSVAEERAHQRRLLDSHRRTLYNLQERAAVFPVGEIPLQLSTQIKAEEREIQKIKQRLAELTEVLVSPPPPRTAPSASQWSSLAEQPTIMGKPVESWLVKALRDPVWQGIAGIIAIIALIVTFVSMGGPNKVASLLAAPTSTPASTPTLTSKTTPTSTRTPASTPTPTSKTTPTSARTPTSIPIQVPPLISTPADIKNGDLETGDFTYWAHGGSYPQSVVSRLSNGESCYEGQHCASLGTWVDCISQTAASAFMYQDFIVPNVPGPVTINFAYRIFTNDMWDWASFQAELRTPDDALLEVILEDGYNEDRIPCNKYLGWKTFSYNVPDRFKGQTMRLRLESRNKFDEGLGIWTYVDAIYLKYTR
jgi:hypothetical protein